MQHMYIETQSITKLKVEAGRIIEFSSLLGEWNNLPFKGVTLVNASFSSFPLFSFRKKISFFKIIRYLTQNHRNW